MSLFRLAFAVLASAILVPDLANAQPPAAPAPAAVGASLDPRLKLKDGDRYLRDLSANLEIPRAEICQELGRYDCFSDAFRIVLGGVDAEHLGINEPLSQEALTAPIALDRVALQVCVNRLARDVADPANAVLLKGLGRSGPTRAWMRRTAGELYGRILARAPSASETAKLLAFYKTVEASNVPAEDRARDWVTLGCFAVASSTENVFY